MSCADEKNCNEAALRNKVRYLLGIMLAIFLALSAASFLSSRGQVTPDTVQFGSNESVQGKRVFQAYNCMGCHTMLGNGAYLGPDLTGIYKAAGPAWLAAFLPSANNWPTSAALRVQLQNSLHRTDSGADSLNDYLAKYPGAAERVQRRGGLATHMPNLPFRSGEVDQLIAFMKYTSLMNTEGWPPKPKVNGLEFPQASGFVSQTAAAAPAQASLVSTGITADPATTGRKIAQDTGCLACHATDKKRLIGPGWGGLYGSQVQLSDGTTVKVDDAYLLRSIQEPDAQVSAGYPAGIMPAYGTLLAQDEINDIIAYIRSLQGEE